MISENKSDWEIIRKLVYNSYGKELELVCTSTPEQAIEVAMSDGPFGFIMLDVENPNLEVASFITNIDDLLGDRPLLFIGKENFIATRITQEQLDANEYNDYLYRPLDTDDIKDKINRILEWAKKEDFEASVEEVNPDEFIPMRLKNFYLYKSFPYDIYMELTSTKYQKIILAEKPYYISTLTNYARRNVKYLYIKKDDQIKYLEEESARCIALLKKMPPNHKDIFLVLIKSVTIIHQYLLALGIGETVINLIETTGESIVTIVAKRVTFQSIMNDYPTIYSGVASKSVLAGLIGQIISENMGWSGEANKKKLAVGAILMDFTLEDESFAHANLLTDPILQNLSEEQFEAFSKHPLKAAEVAVQLPSYTELDSLIETHHELPNKLGFPNQPGGHKMTPFIGAFNVSQYIAAEIDGKKVSNELMDRVFKPMAREYNVGSFKQPLAAAIKNLKVTRSKD